METITIKWREPYDLKEVFFTIDWVWFDDAAIEEFSKHFRIANHSYSEKIQLKQRAQYFRNLAEYMENNCGVYAISRVIKRREELLYRQDRKNI